MDHHERVRAYRKYAEEARALAKVERGEIIRQRLIVIAKSWEALAEEEEQRRATEDTR
jgi:hypothetical protein